MCTRRELELGAWRRCEKKMGQVEKLAKAGTSADPLLRSALMRRGLACHVGPREFRDPQEGRGPVDGGLRGRRPSCAKTSREQVMLADKEIFKGLQGQRRAGTRSTGAGARPMEAHIEAILAGPRVRLTLEPLPCGVGLRVQAALAVGLGLAALVSGPRRRKAQNKVLLELRAEVARLK